MGVFDAIPVDGSMSATALAEKLQVEEALLGQKSELTFSISRLMFLVRLMRMVVPSFFAEPSPEVYCHTPTSLVYLFPPLRGGFKMM